MDAKAVYEFQINNLVTYFKSARVKALVRDGKHDEVFPFITALSVVWIKDQNKVMADYLRAVFIKDTVPVSKEQEDDLCDSCSYETEQCPYRGDFTLVKACAKYQGVAE